MGYERLRAGSHRAHFDRVSTDIIFVREKKPVGGTVVAMSWAAFITGCLYFFVAFVLRVSPSVMVSDLMHDFSVGASVLGNLSAFYFYAYASIQIPVGLMMDRIGPRRLMCGAAMLCALGCIVFSFSTSVHTAYIGRAMIGVGAAFGYVGTLTIAAQWFPVQQFAMLGGVLQMFGMAGAVGGQAPTGFMVEAIGWRHSILVFGVVVAIIALLSWLFIRDRAQESRQRVSLRTGLKTVTANSQTWLNAFVGLALTGPMLAFAGLWGVPFLQTGYGMNRTVAAASVSVLFVGWGIAAPLVGLASDRIRRRKPFLIFGCAGLALILSIVLLVPGLTRVALVTLFFTGGVFGATMVVVFANVKELNPRYASGAALGLVNTAVVGSGALFQPLIGVLLDLAWDGQMQAGVPVYGVGMYVNALLVLPLVTFAGLVASLFLRETHCRQIE